MRGAGSASRELPSRDVRIWSAGSENSAPGPVSRGTSRHLCREVTRFKAAVYLTNLTPKERPRRQTTWHLRPLLASRENASRTLPESTLESETVSFAPVADRSCTTHSRAAKPPSRVTQPVCCTDLRTSRLVGAGTDGGSRFENDPALPIRAGFRNCCKLPWDKNRERYPRGATK